jgi:hypothetical protein
MTSLEEELRALGRSAVVPPVEDGLAAKVLERVAEQPVRRSFGEAVRSRWRSLLALLAVLLAGALVAEPVRAQVAEWLNIGGIEAVQVPSGPTTAPGVPEVVGDQTLAKAARTAGFAPVVPKALGTPDDVQASAGFVAMSWRTATGVVRLEQFLTEPSPMYLKKFYLGPEYLKGFDGFWFSTPHELVLQNKQTVRVAGPTLVWVRDGVTFRLEGVPEKDRAVELAR